MERRRLQKRSRFMPTCWRLAPFQKTEPASAEPVHEFHRRATLKLDRKKIDLIFKTNETTRRGDRTKEGMLMQIRVRQPHENLIKNHTLKNQLLFRKYITATGTPLPDEQMLTRHNNLGDGMLCVPTNFDSESAFNNSSKACRR
jgi:hypothetical protein